jgi:hypothetical protein
MPSCFDIENGSEHETVKHLFQWLHEAIDKEDKTTANCILNFLDLHIHNNYIEPMEDK